MSEQDHAAAWDDRLQDWLDGDLEAQEHALVQSHLESCAQCQQSLDALQRLERQLSSALTSTGLDHAFDTRLFAQIDAANDAQRIEARQRAQAELQAELQALARNWKQTLFRLLPSVLAGVAFTLALTMYFDTAQWLRAFAADGAGQIGGLDSSFVHLLLTSAMGAAIGYGIARWLSAAES